MRTKFLLGAVVLTATFAACNNEDIPGSVNMNQSVGDEVVGATLVSKGGDITLGETESRVSTDGKWEPSDKLALAWYNLNSTTGSILEEQNKLNWNGTGNDKSIYANHLFTRTNDGLFVTNSNIYQGAHFIYFPYVYSGKPGEMVVNVNTETQSDEFTKDVLNKALYVSAQDFIEEKDVDKKTGKLAKNFYITPAVNTLKVNATPETGISSNSFLKNLEISKLDIWNEEAVFNVTATVDPNKIPMVQFDEDGEFDLGETYKALKENLAKAFESTPVTNLTTTIDADLTLANANSLRAFTLPTAVPSQEKDWTEIAVHVKANGDVEGVAYDMGYFRIYVKGQEFKNEKNQKALVKLQEALYDKTKAYSLQDNLNSNEKLNWVGIDIDLKAAEFVADFKISNLEEWNLTVAMVDALNSLKAAGEVKIKPEFILTGNVCVTEGETINVPANGMTVVTIKETAEVCFETDYTVNAALANVFDANDNVKVVAGSALTIADNAVLKAAVHNDGIVNVGYKAQLGDKNNANVDNEHGRINVVYGSYVYANVNGTIAYEVAANEYAYRINNLLASTGNTLGYAYVNTLVVGENVTFNAAKTDGNIPQQDPYESDAVTGETIDATLLKKTDIELVGGNLCALITAKKTVKNVKVLASTTASSIKDINIDNDLTVMKGATVTFDATTNALNQKATATINGAIKNEGVLNTAVSIKTKNVFNEKKGQSILSVLGKEVVWYTGNYYQGGMAQGDILKLVGTYTALTASENLTNSKILSGTFDGQGNALTLNVNPTTFNYLTTGSGAITVTNLTIDAKNYISNLYTNDGKVKNLRAFYLTNATSILLNNITVKNVGYVMNMYGTDASKATNKMTVTNCDFEGWLSYDGNFATVTFRNTTFKTGDYFENPEYPFYNGGIRPYSTTVIEDCTFDEDFYLCIEMLTSDVTLTLKNCKVGETVITKSNYKTLLNIEGDASKLVYLTIE